MKIFLWVDTVSSQKLLKNRLQILILRLVFYKNKEGKQNGPRSKEN